MRKRIVKLLTTVFCVGILSQNLGIADAPGCSSCLTFIDYNDPDYTYESDGNCYKGSTWCSTIWRCKTNGTSTCGAVLCNIQAPPGDGCNTGQPE